MNMDRMALTISRENARNAAMVNRGVSIEKDVQ